MEHNHRADIKSTESISNHLSHLLYGSSVPESFNANLSDIRQALVPFIRFYKEEDIEEVDVKNYILGRTKIELQNQGFSEQKVAYNLDTIWLHPDKAFLLAVLLKELTILICQNLLPQNLDSTLEIKCQLINRQIVFIFTLKGAKILSASYNDSSLKLFQRTTELINGKLTLETDPEYMFRLSLHSTEGILPVSVDAYLKY